MTKTSRRDSGTPSQRAAGPGGGAAAGGVAHWQPRMRLYLYTAAGSGTTGQVRVLVDGVQWGDPVTTGAVFDRTALVAEDFNARFGSLLKVEIQAQVTTGTGVVYAQPLMMYGTQS
ncbi:hypothetical protein [Streptomyces sp. NPDC002990]